jgi:hypothetical protein
MMTPMKTNKSDDEVLQHCFHIERGQAMAKLTARMFMTALQELDGYDWGLTTVFAEMKNQNEALVMKFLQESGACETPSQPTPF